MRAVRGAAGARVLRGVPLMMVLLALGAVPARASYERVDGGLVSPSSISAGGQTDYSVALVGRPAVVDVVFVLDTSGSMATSQPPAGTRWDAEGNATKTFLAAFDSSGFFARGGRAGLVTFSDAATTAAPPGTDSAPLVTAINGTSPLGGGCISCGVQRATELLSAIPGAASHRQIVYLLADGADTGAAGALTAAITASNAARIERRLIGIGPDAVSAGLEAIDSDGVVPNTTSLSSLTTAYGSPPALPGATNVSWTFKVTPAFSISRQSASTGSVTVTGHDVTWTIPSLGSQTATLSFHATHVAAGGCAMTSLLTGTSFADAESDPTPSVGLAPLAVSGCSGSPPPASARAVSGLAVTPVQRGSKVKATATIGIAGSSVRLRLLRRSGKAKPRLVGTAARSSTAAGTTVLSVKLNAAGRALLRKRRTLTLQLQITVTPPSGQGAPITQVRTVKLTR